VKEIQGFLKDEGLLTDDLVTGYYGERTEGAVKAWQKKKGIVISGDPLTTGFGQVGERTRAEMRRGCGGGSNPGGGITTNTAVDFDESNPTASGAKPLTVFFSYTTASNTQYIVDFGDGSRGAVTFGGCKPQPFGLESCAIPRLTHTYTTAGTYTAELIGTDPSCSESDDVCDKKVLKRARITVSEGEKPTLCTKEYVPVCGAKPITCVTTPCNPVPQTYGNRCMMQADNATFLYEGVCRSS
jgi:PKD repeat protein